MTPRYGEQCATFPAMSVPDLGCKRLLFAVLTFAQTGDCSRIAGVDQKLKSPDSFEGNDFTLAKSFHRIFEAAVQLRTAHGAGIRLRVKPAIRRILVLLAATRTQYKLAHRRVGPVIRNVEHNRVARPAIRTVRERILETAIARIEQFFAAIGAGGKVGQDVDGFPGIVVDGQNLEARRALRRQPRELANVHHRSLLPHLLESLLKAAQLLGRPFDFPQQARVKVQHPPGEGQLRGQTEDKGSKAHSLNGSAQSDPEALSR